LPTYLN